MLFPVFKTHISVWVIVSPQRYKIERIEIASEFNHHHLYRLTVYASAFAAMLIIN